MITRSRTFRASTLAAGVASLAFLAGCGGGGPAAGTSTPAPSAAKPQITDPAVQAAALRTVDPCALLDSKTLGDLGTPDQDSLSSSEWGECGVDVKDAGGQTVELVLRVGHQLIMPDDPVEQLEGLPLVVDADKPGSCWVSVVTSFEQSLGITVQSKSPGGDACAPGRTALTKVVQALRGTPPQYQQVPGSVLTTDPCAVADRQAVEAALQQKSFVEPKSLHQCDLWSGDGTSYPQVSVRLYQGLPADAEDGEPADLGGGVTAIQKKDADSSVVSCDVSWRRVETPKEDEARGYGEIVSVQFSGEPESGLDTATACSKAVAVAKTVVPSLGRA
ncbi:DUF3558 family protein [Amycolatopsis sp. YIM 10]|uniref:DUF3558 family protein n=1 Tax=Amycolatopsis sp. YIM 10 TaxID=2653857 RepID=UPI00128FD509|nr:DUF3558 family protein [Amycolatopsis sp. YIM 10]QFU91149.1 hypothetical protein YIM_29915 [Amycolatopsis sp. YIM 10]